MLEYLFIVCQYWSNPPVLKRVHVVKEIIVCDRDSNIHCSEGFRVIFNGEKVATNVRETSCLYITKDNIEEIEYEK